MEVPKSCKFIIYEKGNEIEKKIFYTYNLPFEMRIYDIRMEIMWDIYTNDRDEHEELYYLEMEYIGAKVFKDFGKLFFDKGKVPKTNDSYPLSKFTSEERTYEFVVYRVNKKDLDDYIPVRMMSKEEAKRICELKQRIDDHINGVSRIYDSELEKMQKEDEEKRESEREILRKKDEEELNKEREKLYKQSCDYYKMDYNYYNNPYNKNKKYEDEW